LLTQISPINRTGGSINFTIEIKTINHFLNNRAQTLNDYNSETERVFASFKENAN